MNGTYSDAAGCVLRVYAAGSLSSEIEAHSNPRKLVDAVAWWLRNAARVDLDVTVPLDGYTRWARAA